MSRQAFDKKLEALAALRAESDPDSAIGPVRKALTDRNNYVVSKAAALASHFNLTALVPDLLTAFDRFLVDPHKSDPQCWAKNAVAKALRDLDHRDPDFYVRGISYSQPEPAWGGPVDSAATLRGTCALALVDCPLDDLDILSYLTDALADAEKSVRIDAATAIGQLSRPEGTLLLRLKALVGDPEPEVLGACFTSLLAMPRQPVPRESIGFVARFLKVSSDEIRLEAAGALALSPEPAALAKLRDFWRDRMSPETRSTVIAFLGACPLPEAAEFLLGIVADGAAPLASGAIAALAAGRFREDVRDRASALVESRRDETLRGFFEKEFADSTGP